MEAGRWESRVDGKGPQTDRRTARHMKRLENGPVVVGRTSQKEFVSIYASRCKFDKMTDMLHIKTTEIQYYMRTPDR